MAKELQVTHLLTKEMVDSTKMDHEQWFQHIYDDMLISIRKLATENRYILDEEIHYYEKHLASGEVELKVVTFVHVV